jgi:hypothetical protein
MSDIATFRSLLIENRVGENRLDAFHTPSLALAKLLGSQDVATR